MLTPVSPQRSNRQNLLEGTLRCLEEMPMEQVTARAIAAESGANLASIGYHFSSKEELVTEAVILGLDRWLAEIESGLADLVSHDPALRLERAGNLIASTRRRHLGLARTFAAAIAKAQHDPKVRDLLAEGFTHTRPALAALLGLGEDEPGRDAAGLVHSMFVGLLFQSLIDPELAIEGERMTRAQARLRDALPAAVV
jgi:AcrR family transcriptional regulator